MMPFSFSAYIISAKRKPVIANAPPTVCQRFAEGFDGSDGGDGRLRTSGDRRAMAYHSRAATDDSTSLINDVRAPL
jgi:hypothetical protein